MMALMECSKGGGSDGEEIEGLMEEKCGVKGAWKTSMGDGGKVVQVVGKLFSAKPGHT